MPTVPDLVPTQQASLGGTPEVNVPAPVEAFGGAIGHAISGLGTEVEKSGDLIWQRAMQLQDLQNRSEVDKGDAAYMEQAGKLHADFTSLQGENATAAFPKYIQDLKDAREQIRGGLSNPMVQKMYDSQTLSTMGRTIFNGAGHAGQQAKVARLDTLNAKQTSIVSMAASSNDPATQRWAQGQLGNIVREKHDIKGTPDSVPDEMQIVNSSLATNTVVHQSKSDPITAYEDLENLHSQGKITEDDYQKAYNSILPRRNSMIAQNTADEVFNSGMKDGEQTQTLDEMDAEVKKRIRSVAPDDALLGQHAVNMLHAEFNQRKSAQNAEKYQNTQKIDSAILTGQVHTERDLQNNPETSKAYDDLPASVKRGIPGKINNYNRAASDYENSQTFDKLAGMAVSGDPEVVAKFMDTDIMSQPMNTSNKLRLNAMRDKILKSGATDSRVARAMGWLRHDAGGQLEALKLYRRDPNNPDDYDQFQGQLHNALEQWQTDHGKPASESDIVEKIGPLLMKGRGDAGWFHSETHEFNKPPEEFSTQMQAEATKRNLPALSDRELSRMYVQAQLKKHYPPAKKSQPNAPPEQ